MRAKAKTVEELCSVNTEELAVRIGQIPEADWEAFNALKPNKYNEIDAANHIVFAFPHHVETPEDFQVYEHYTNSWRTVIEPIIKHVNDTFYQYDHYATPRIMLAKLPPQKKIALHIDGRQRTWPHKVHVPIQTNEKVKFIAGTQLFYLEEQKAYEVNNSIMHGGANNGETDRIHLIFEIIPK